MKKQSLKDKLLQKYSTTFGMLDDDVKHQISSGFQIIGLALLIGAYCVYATFHEPIITGFLALFGVSLIITSRILFK